MNSHQLFEQYGAIHVSKMIPIEFCYFLTHILMREYAIKGKQGDHQTPTALAAVHGNIALDTLHEQLWPTIEKYTGHKLLPTYSYARLYNNGDTLEKHTDRLACEISVTIQLGRSHHYAWPIYMANQRYDLGEGDGVIYKGCDVSHWRNVCDGPHGYYSGQVFLHYVREDGPYAEHAGDKRWTDGVFPYEKNRTIVMESK